MVRGSLKCLGEFFEREGKVPFGPGATAYGLTRLPFPLSAFIYHYPYSTRFSETGKSCRKFFLVGSR